MKHIFVILAGGCNSIALICQNLKTGLDSFLVQDGNEGMVESLVEDRLSRPA